MKNISKNSYSKKNSNNINKRSQSKDNYSANKFREDKINIDNKNTFQRDNKRTDDPNRNNFSNIKSKDKPKDKFNHTKRKLSSNKSKTVNFKENSPKNFQSNSYERNFDDWIWGKHSVIAALKSERPINRIWCTSEIFSSEKFYILLKDFKSKGVLIEEVSWSRISQLTSGAIHQGVALQLSSSKTISLNKLIDLSKSKSSNPILVALDGVTDPHNLGAIIRSAEAFDCKGIIIPQRRSAGLTGTVAKVAAGALEHIPVSRVVNLNRAIEDLKKKGFIIVGLTQDGQVPIYEFVEKAPVVVVVGSEDKGISLLTQKNCDYLLKIPIKGKTSSLNASVAASISFCFLSSY